MPRRCTVCSHIERERIDRDLVACGDPYRTIAARWSVSKTALLRHQSSHLPTSLAMAEKAEEVARAGRILANVQQLQEKAVEILAHAESERDWRTALQAIREARSCLKLLGRLAGELQDSPTVNVLLLPQWSEIKEALLEALDPYPDARSSVAVRLQAFDARE